MSQRSGLITFVLPAYCEAENLAALIPRILAVELGGLATEVLIVDDHSTDATFPVVRGWAAVDPRVRGVRLARNVGSHMAILCGLQRARGDGVLVLAADGQDPPEVAPELVAAWRGGAQVVWAVRASRAGESRLRQALSRRYYAMMNRLTSVTLPATGADFVLLDRRVVDVITSLRERNTSLFALISWLGFRRAEIPYRKEARWSGASKWSFRRRVRLAMDSLFGFSVLPLKVASGMGLVYAAAGFLYAGALVVNKLAGGALFGDVAWQGWSALMVVVLVSSGSLMFVLGLFGEYLWRTLDEVRGRPQFVVEEETSTTDRSAEPRR